MKNNEMKLFALLLVLVNYMASGQSISSFVPSKIDKENKYVFYLHGRIVQEQGVNAVSPEYGRYEYQRIVDTLKTFGFNVISERRPKGTDAAEYASKVAKQIDSLLVMGLDPKNIVVVGASMGAGITAHVVVKVKNNKINYALLAACSEEMFAYYADNKLELCGNFLSIYESTDMMGSCDKLFLHQSCKSGYKEIKLTMGNQHGFIYKPYAEWVLPLVKWINEKR